MTVNLSSFTNWKIKTESLINLLHVYTYHEEEKKNLDKMEIVLHVPKSKLSRRKVPLFRNLPSISRASNRMAVTDLRFSWEAIVRCQGLDPRNSRTKPSWDFPDPVFQTSNSAILWDFNRSLVLLSKRIIFSLLTPSNLAFYKKENIYFDN